MPAWTRNYIHYKVWDKITYTNFIGANTEVWEWISIYIAHFIGHLIADLCDGLIIDIESTSDEPEVVYCYYMDSSSSDPATSLLFIVFQNRMIESVECNTITHLILLLVTQRIRELLHTLHFKEIHCWLKRDVLFTMLINPPSNVSSMPGKYCAFGLMVCKAIKCTFYQHGLTENRQRHLSNRIKGPFY